VELGSITPLSALGHKKGQQLEQQPGYFPLEQQQVTGQARTIEGVGTREEVG